MVDHCIPRELKNTGTTFPKEAPFETGILDKLLEFHKT